MYASKRTVTKASGVLKNHYKPKSHRANKGGRSLFTQVIRDKDSGLVVKTITHDATGDSVFNLKKRKRRLRKSMSSQPK